MKIQNIHLFYIICLFLLNDVAPAYHSKQERNDSELLQRERKYEHLKRHISKAFKRGYSLGVKDRSDYSEMKHLNRHVNHRLERGDRLIKFYSDGRHANKHHHINLMHFADSGSSFTWRDLAFIYSLAVQALINVGSLLYFENKQ